MVNMGAAASRANACLNSTVHSTFAPVRPFAAAFGHEIRPESAILGKTSGGDQDSALADEP
jgi:hypothetical protein